MKRIVATLVALSVAAAVVAPMAAEARAKKKKRTYYQPYATQGYSAPRNEVYQEFLADKRPDRDHQLVAADGPRGARRAESRELSRR